MASSKSSLAMFALAIVMAVVAGVSAQNTPQDFVNLHNRARAADGVGAVTWDNSVARSAQDYANKRAADCRLQHSGGPFGENIFWGSGQSWTAANAVKSWVDEKRNYHLNTNTCDAGKVCGHYTQVVWRKSTRIGCARVVCAGNRGVFIICNYNPPGNFNGDRPFAFLTLDAEAK
uniref:Pathogenesis-related protein 1-21 n=1 Tax=Triticum aestivum TaxID=4565 RepID=A0A0A7AC96_WHEAT|nr:pathogenesis-related protein 1-21 [Triticum aestivum]